MISPASDTRTSSLPMSASSSSRPRTNSSRITWSSNSKAESTASPRAAASRTLPTPIDDPRFAGFTKSGQAERRRRLLHHLGRPRGAGHHSPCRHREPVVVQYRLGDPLVHADGGGEHAGPDVGQLQRLEVSLDHAVLAEGAVEHREHDGVRLAARRRGAQARCRDDARTRTSGEARASTSSMSARTCSASTNCLSWVSPITFTANPASSAVRTMRRAEMHETSCSADGPP